MSDESIARTELQDLSTAELTDVNGGWDWKTVGEYAAPLLMANPLTAPLGVYAMNKPAAAQGAIWGAGGAIAGAGGGVPGAALGAAGGGLAGYYSTLVGRDFPATK